MRWARTEAGARVEVDSEADTERLAQALAPLVTPGTVIALTGELGAGKTRFTRALAEALGADPTQVSSPTFVLVHEYDADMPILHIDTYRLKSIGEFEALGLGDELGAGGLCLIEWADRVEQSLPTGAWRVAIAAQGPGPHRRAFEVHFPGAPAVAHRFAEQLDRLNPGGA